MKYAFRLEQPSDWEGRSSHVIGVFAEQKDAMTVGKSGFGNRSMGPSAGTVSRVEVFESVQEFAENNPKYDGTGLSPGEKAARLRAQGLAKLSAEEREALGIR